MTKVWIFIILFLIIFVLGFVVVLMQKSNKKLKDENKKLSDALVRQKDIIKEFQKNEKEANEQKAKLGKGSIDDRINTSLDILRDIESRR